VIEIFDVTADDPRTVDAARHLLHHALPLDLGDDRFNHRWVEKLDAAANRFAGVVANGGGHPIGFLGGVADGDTLFLEALVADHHQRRPTAVLDAMLDRVLDHQVAEGRRIEIWGKPSMPWHEEAARDHGLVLVRSLHQMRCPLPVPVNPLPTRPFVPGVDDEALRLLNNAAFKGHPDQGQLDPAEFAHKLAEPGVSPEGIRLYEHDGQLAGFCWTKIHHDRGLGEIYAIGLDPRMHGRGLGQAMTASGLDWLHQQGLETGMLYVEADNEPAIRTYEKLGFDIVRTDRAWASAAPSPAPDAAPS
jgi:mycothiol synthase